MTDTNSLPPDATLEDALNSGALAIINASEEQDLYQLLAALRALAEEKTAVGATGQAQAVQLLIWCYSMRLDAGNKTEPFQPAHRMANGGTTAKPDHLTPAQVQLLAGLYGDVKPPARRARLADLVGLKIRQRRIDHVVAAIDAYIATPLDREQWFEGSEHYWHRALRLAMSFYAGVGKRFETIEHALFAAFERACETSEGTEPLWYLRPLQAEDVGTHAGAIANRLQQLADDHSEKGAWDAAEYAYQVAAYWFGRAKNPERSAAMLNARAVVTERKADSHDQGILRQSFYTDALRCFREVDGRFHAALRVREAIERVQLKLEDAGRAAIGEMQTIKTRIPRNDVADLVEDAIAHVRGKSPLEALLAFMELDHWPSRAAYLAQAKDGAEVGIFASLVGSTYLASDGRQVKHVAPLNGDDQGDADAIELKAMQYFVQTAQFTAQTALSPALSEIYMEHALSLADFQVIAHDCPTVPMAHARAVALGLHAGYERDFVTALHILLPQFENIVRALLKAAGVLTTRTDDSGISMEVGLSALVKEPKLVEILGGDVVFGISTLMCTQVGPNFRNDIAHGLATSADCNTFVGMYTWWFIFRLVFIQWHLVSQPTDSPEVSASDSFVPGAPPTKPTAE